MSEPRPKEHEELINSTIASKNKTETALHDLDRILIAALALLTIEEGRIDVELDDRKDALETLLEYARGAVGDGQKGLAEVWHVTTKYLFGEQAESATDAAEQEEA